MATTHQRKRLLIAAVGVGALAVGGAGYANASNGSGAGQPTYTGSVQAPAEQSDREGSESAQSEESEAAALQRLAKITPEQAKAAASAAAGGTATDVQLGNENGSVVYEVTMTGAKGQATTEVKVDAGTGEVLQQETDQEGAASTGEEGQESDAGPDSGRESGSESGPESGPVDAAQTQG